jgi:hypothetical protein
MRFGNDGVLVDAFLDFKCSSAIRCHHLLKTFYAGFGWKDRQCPDGAIVWTAPTGHTYTTEAQAADCFPHWPTPTPTCLTPPSPPNPRTTT